MQTEDIILVLDNAKKLRNEVQEQLKKYVHDKNIPLEERFRVWIAYCDKKNHRTIENDFIRKMNAKGIICFGYNTINWRDALRKIINTEQINEIKELLIEENFGSLMT